MLFALAAAVAVLASLLVFASNASAVALPRGRFASATQLSTTRNVTITGWAYDPARSSTAVRVGIYLDGRYVGSRPTNVLNGKVNRAYHLRGVHGFRLVFRAPKPVSKILIRVRSAATHQLVSVAVARVAHVTPPSTRIMTVAARLYRAHTPYVYGGTTPRGFDCSGYTQYVYRVAHVATLPRTAEQQRRAVRHLRRSQLLPGDLIFYLSGGSAYHVAIYAGHGMQYAEATPRDGLRYQKIWSSDIQYGTTWH